MQNSNQEINKILKALQNNILDVEEVVLQRKPFKDISIIEIHTIEAVGERKEGTMSQIAGDLGITVGTLTVSINHILNKGYVYRERSKKDRRIVLISLTKKGEIVYRMHRKFHYDLVNATVKGVSEEEKYILLKALNNINKFCLERINSIKIRKR